MINWCKMEEKRANFFKIWHKRRLVFSFLSKEVSVKTELFSCVRAEVESPQRREPLGTRRQKSELVSSFCRLASPRLTPADLEP